MLGAGAALLVLDVDGTLNKEDISLNLQKQFPSIADVTVFNEIANAVAKKSIEIPLDDNGNKYVQLEEETISRIISRIDTTGIEAEITKLVLALK